jgi:type III secretion protein C
MKLFIRAFAFTLGLGISMQAHAQFRAQAFEINADRRPIKEFLREFAQRQGLDINIDNSIEGSVSGKFTLRPEALLNTLAISHRFKWYFDGSILQIVPDSEMVSEVLSVPDADLTALPARLRRLGLLDSKFPIIVSARAGTVRISGPRRYVDSLRQAIKSFEDSPTLASSNRSEIRVFALQHVWAADTRTATNGAQATVPGVVSILKRLYNVDAGSITQQGVGSRVQQIGGRSNFNVPGTRESVAVDSNQRDLYRDMLRNADPSSARNQGQRQQLPQFEADQRQNAIIVRDLPERLGQYAEVINRLDQPGSLVEIDVKIIEVSSRNVEELGIDWRLRNQRGSLERGNPSGGPVNGGSFTLLAGSAAKELMLRVNALEECGQARIESSPKILTLANIEALVESRSEFFVRVAGNQDANLFSVQSGTSLKVTPMYNANSRDKMITMSIQIEDGALSPQRVDNIPIVNRNVINTQTAVTSGESLLIAGYSREVSNESSGGVQGLGKLPLIGTLFGDNRRSSEKVERFVLLTPRVVSAEAGRLK